MAQPIHPPPNTLITQTELPSMARTAQQSLFCVEALLQDVVQSSWKQIKLNRLFSLYLQPYSNTKTMDNMQQLNTFLYSMAPQADRMNRQEDEPTPLIIDSLLPISADIDAENTYKKNNSIKKLIQQDSTTRSRFGDRESIDQREKYTKLQITEVSEEDGFTKELRKIEEQRNMKAQGERKAVERKRQLEAQKLKDKKKNQKEQKFSYDYNGQVIEIKLQSKANLISKVINGATNPNPTISKEIIKDPKPIQVEPTNRKEKKLFAVMGKRKDDVQFSEVKSLADNIKATQGVKYTYEGKTYQEKQKAVSVAELRKTLSQRRISKDDYKRIRQLNGNKQDYEEALKKSRMDAANRPQSQPKRGGPAPAISKRTERIHVNSHDLKGKLLEKPPQQEYLTERKDPESEANLQGEEKIGSIDTFNLEYLRTGGTIHASTSKDFFRQRSDNELPRITHTTLYSKVLPKGRERIKEANQIIRDLRKKFEQKLRV